MPVSDKDLNQNAQTSPTREVRLGRNRVATFPVTLSRFGAA
jgi:hypothetical protein